MVPASKICVCDVTATRNFPFKRFRVHVCVAWKSRLLNKVSKTLLIQSGQFQHAGTQRDDCGVTTLKQLQFVEYFTVHPQRTNGFVELVTVRSGGVFKYIPRVLWGKCLVLLCNINLFLCEE